MAFELEKRLAYGMTQADLVNAIKNNNTNQGAGFIEKNGAQWLIRIPGQIEDINDLGSTVVKTTDGASVPKASTRKGF